MNHINFFVQSLTNYIKKYNFIIILIYPSKSKWHWPDLGRLKYGICEPMYFIFAKVKH